jgi:dihydroxyacid dehydratase/phosphogluconate dehydratase
LMLVSGPRPVAYFEGRRIGTGTDLWRLWDQRRAGELSDERWAELEAALTLGKGTCNTMGTASTMGALAESLGLAWPGSTSIPAGDGRHANIARHIGERIVALALTHSSVTTQISPDSVENALVVLSAIGGSTNAVIHLTAMARRLGYSLDLDDVDRVSRATPVLVDVEPSGTALLEDLDAAGGFPSLFRALDTRLVGDVLLANGRTMKDVQASAVEPRGVIHEPHDPVDAEGAFRVVSGNLAPDGALIKRSAATASLLQHRGPAYVVDADDPARRTGVDSTCPEDAVLVLAGAGPIGGPGMPEWGMIPIPEPLLARGVSDMVRVTDARMSGTSFGTVFLHAAPEAAAGGVIGLVRDGDLISVDADAGLIHLEVDDEELERRRQSAAPMSHETRGYVELYRRHVTQAPLGCDFDFLATPIGEAPFLVEPVVGRS